MQVSIRRLLAIPVLAVTLLLTAAGTSSAAVGDGPALAGSSAREDPATLAVHANGYTASVKAADPACISAAKAAQAAVGSSFCTATTTYTQSKTTVATAAELAADHIDAATASSTIWVYSWSENTRGITWNEVHGGKTYFDHSYVWGRYSYRGFKGYHTCDIGGSYAVGYVIDVVHCYTTPTISTYRIQSYDIFKVTAGFHGIPISFTHSMHVNMYPSGSIYYH